MTHAHPAAPSPTRTRRTYPLKDLDVAPENLRFGQPADEDIPRLAATLLAAGQLQPLTVRPGRRKEKPAMALDGRRRLLAFGLLLTEGAIGEDHPVEVFEETDPARQAAASVLTNTAAPVHVADVIVAIGRMLKARLTPAVIAGALGYAEIEVRRLAALSGLHPRALQALKAGKLSLRQAKLLARLADPEVQAEIAESVLEGYGFPDHRVNHALEVGGVAAGDPRRVLVGPARYAAACGRIEADLFGERPDTWLDDEVLDRAWLARAADLGARLGLEGIAVHVSVEPSDLEIEDLEPVGDPYGGDLDGEAREAWRDLALAAADARQAAAQAEPASDAADEALLTHLRAALTADRASEPERTITALVLRPAAGVGLAITAYGPSPAEPEVEAWAPNDLVETVGDRPAPPAAGEGVNHALHEVRTDAATRALIRGLADDPAAALTAVIARLFDVLVLHSGRAAGGGASSLMAEAYGRPRSRVIEPLDGVVRQRLADRRSAWRASDRTVIGWVSELGDADRMGLLAELVALSLDLREERTTAIRPRARDEAAELAVLCRLDVAAHWTPDEAVLRAHSKGQLIAMLDEMGAGDLDTVGLKKDPLVTLVAEQAAQRRWAPAWLSWGAAPDAEGAVAGAADKDAQDTEAAGQAA